MAVVGQILSLDIKGAMHDIKIHINVSNDCVIFSSIKDFNLKKDQHLS
jgi:hypothetical protein